MATKNEIFSDIDLRFSKNPFNDRLNRKLNREAVRQSVKSLILTDYYERPFKSDIGCNIRHLLFELFTPAIKQIMEDAIRTTIKTYEPRADLIAVLVEPYEDRNSITVSVAFMVQHDPDPVVLDVILERVR